MSEVRVFYSWQSDRPNATNRTFIEVALEKAARSLSKDPTVQVEPVVDRHTRGKPGAPEIAQSIFGKIDESVAFVADVTFINSARSQRPTQFPGYE